MATHRLGKLKLNFSDQGFAFRWGDGEIHRLNLRKKNESQEEYEEEYDEEYGAVYGDYPENPDYDDDYASDDDADYDYADDEYNYNENGYDDGDYDDDADYFVQDGYDDGDYDSDDYVNDDYGDGSYGDNGYEDDYDDDYAAGYNDRYSEEDADAGEYGDDGYYDYDDGINPIIRYIDENDWVTYLLLFLLPPLGIYLLWRRNRFDRPIQYVWTAVSLVWFILMIIILVTVIFGGSSGDSGTDFPLSQPTISSDTETIAPTTSDSVDPLTEPFTSPSATPTETIPNISGPSPSPTPLGGGTQISTANYVYSVTSDTYYHKTNTCPKLSGTASYVTLSLATQRNQVECPDCYNLTTYYGRSDGRWYHTNSTCGDMQNATVVTLQAAGQWGLEACPVCVLGTQQSLVPKGVVIINENTTDKSGISVWYTRGGDNYHITSNCRNMSGASQHSLKEALLAGKTACETCCAVSGVKVYCTEGGSRYHVQSNCDSMRNAKLVTLAEALVLGKAQCTLCITTNANLTPTQAPQPGTTGTGIGNNTTGAIYVYATPGGKAYHTDSTCDGMRNAQRVLLSDMIAINRPACEICCSGANMTVYASVGGTYYHSYATCSRMTQAQQGTLANALAIGLQRCPYCWSETGSVPNNNTSTPGTTSMETATADNIYVYARADGTYYHTLSNCTSMQNASRITLRTAINAGKTACPTCAAAAKTMVYSTQTGENYHLVADCRNMSNALRRTLADALMLNQTACSICMTGNNSNSTTTPAPNPNQSGTPNSGNNSTNGAGFVAGTSGVKVYAVANKPYFHTSSSCSGMTNASHISLETALNAGKAACPTCAAAAGRTVYATLNGKYYHVSKSCAGGGAVGGNLAYALAYGFEACPYCIAQQNTNEPEANVGYVVGTSGIKVYTTVNGPYYHTNQNCAGSNASLISLETALNNGKSACQICCALAERTVYVARGSTIYHANRSCAGSNAIAGPFARALALGMTPCSNCIGNGSVATPVIPESTAPGYSAPASTRVYIDLYADTFYYHKSSSCSKAGMSSGTAVTLEYALDWSYVRCPYCNPATEIETTFLNVS